MRGGALGVRASGLGMPHSLMETRALDVPKEKAGADSLVESTCGRTGRRRRALEEKGGGGGGGVEEGVRERETDRPAGAERLDIVSNLTARSLCLGFLFQQRHPQLPSRSPHQRRFCSSLAAVF